MKKFLALVLALVMTFSLVTIAGAEDFTDNSDITYEEAVDVMTAIGVVGGYADGSFNPTAGLTRGAAAKIICNMILGPTTAGALVANDAPYSDVAADNVFAGYIAYCANEGIISGYADGTFRPAAPLTGYAFMKMLLGALGYDAAIEGYTGNNWSIQVAKRALAIDLDAGLVTDFAGAKALTREEAALYAFNTLKATMVEYKNASTITVGDIVVSSSAAATKVETASSDSYNSDDDGYVQFCEQYFSKLLKTGTVDNYKSAANTWSYKGVKVGTYAGSATLTYTDKMEASDIEADLENYNNYGASVALYKNGKNTTVTASATAIAALTGNGVTVEVYVSDNGITKVVLIEPVVAIVTAISDKNETITVAVEGANSGWGQNTTTFTTTKGYGDVEVDDVVLVYAYNNDAWRIAGATVTAVEVLETVEGLATKKSTAKDTITIDGVAYEASAKIAKNNDVADFTVSAKYDATLYLDEFGYVVYAKSGTAATDDTAVAVLNAYQGLNEDGELVYMVKGVTSNGETVIWEAAADYTSAENKMRNYSETDDVYTLATTGMVNTASANMTDGTLSRQITLGADVAANAKTFTTDNSQKLYFADDVKTIYINAGKASVKDGVQKMTAGTNINITVEVVDTVPYITAVFVSGTAANTTVSVNDLVLVLAGDTGNYEAYDENDDLIVYDTMDAYIAGEKVDEFYTLDESIVLANGFYTVEIDNDTKDYVLDNNAYIPGDDGALSVSAEETYTALVGTILSGSNDYDISGATFVDTTDNDYTSFAEIKADINDAGSAVSGAKFMVVYDYDTGVASYVYVTAIL